MSRCNSFLSENSRRINIDAKPLTFHLLLHVDSLVGTSMWRIVNGVYLRSAKICTVGLKMHFHSIFSKMSTTFVKWTHFLFLFSHQVLLNWSNLFWISDWPGYQVGCHSRDWRYAKDHFFIVDSWLKWNQSSVSTAASLPFWIRDAVP